MSKSSLLIMLVLLFFITGCTQSTFAESEGPTFVQTPFPTATSEAVRPVEVAITPKPDVKLADSTSEELKLPPTLTAVPTTDITQLTATATPTQLIPLTILVNNIPTQQFVLMPQETIKNSQQIFARGQALGRNPHRFSKIGDSIVDTDQFFTPFDNGNYSLGDYQYLEGTVQYYSGSYGRFGFALRDGLNSTAVMDPMWADKTSCVANEAPLACEIRRNNPSILLIHFGTNDWTGTFAENMRQIIEHTINEGIVPVLITKANRVEANNERNDILRHLATEYHIPLWDFDLLANTLPDRGLAPDNAHLTISGNFNYALSEPILKGYKAFNLSGLILLDSFLHHVVLSIS